MASSSSTAATGSPLFPPPPLNPPESNSELFDSYEVDLQLVQTSLSYEVERLRELSSPSSAPSASTAIDVTSSSEFLAAESYLEEADEIMAQMQLEISHTPATSRRFLRTRLKAHKQELDVFRKTLVSFRRGHSGVTGRQQKRDRWGLDDDAQEGRHFLGGMGGEDDGERERLLEEGGEMHGMDDGLELEDMGIPLGGIRRSAGLRMRQQERFWKRRVERVLGTLGAYMRTVLQQRRIKTLAVAGIVLLVLILAVGVLAKR